MRYRSVHPEIEAILWTGKNDDEVRAFVGVPEHFFTDAYLPNQARAEADLWVAKSGDYLFIQAPCWIIREPDGTGCYPCDPVIFAQRWEPIPEPEPAPSKECRGVAWFGQPMDHCDRCGQPWYAHEGMERLVVEPFAETVLFEIEPWTGKHLERHEQWKREQAKEADK